MLGKPFSSLENRFPALENRFPAPSEKSAFSRPAAARNTLQNVGTFVHVQRIIPPKRYYALNLKIYSVTNILAIRHDFVTIRDDVVTNRDDVVTNRDDVVTNRDDVVTNRDDVVTNRDLEFAKN